MITFETFVNTLDADQPYLYVFLLILLSSLFVLKLNKKDLSFMLINIVLYTIITTTIFYSYVAVLEKRPLATKECDQRGGPVMPRRMKHVSIPSRTQG